MKCKHKDGWLLDTEDIVINDYQRNNDIECLARCNHYGCKQVKRIQFDIVNITETDEYEVMPLATHKFRNNGINKHIQSNICELCYRSKENNIHK